MLNKDINPNQVLSQRDPVLSICLNDVRSLTLAVFLLCKGCGWPAVSDSYSRAGSHSRRGLWAVEWLLSSETSSRALHQSGSVRRLMGNARRSSLIKHVGLRWLSVCWCVCVDGGDAVSGVCAPQTQICGLGESVRVLAASGVVCRLPAPDLTERRSEPGTHRCTLLLAHDPSDYT